MQSIIQHMQPVEHKVVLRERETRRWKEKRDKEEGERKRGSEAPKKFGIRPLELVFFFRGAVPHPHFLEQK